MAVEVVMPKFGMSMEEGTIVEWLKQKGDTVQKGDPLVTISTDKITNELESPESGVLLDVVLDVDETAEVGATIAFIGQEGESTESTVLPDTTAKEEKVAVPVQNEQTSFAPAVSKTEPHHNGRIKISPAAKKLARAHDIAYEGITGTGPKGRITKKDVQLALEQGQSIVSKAPLQAEKALEKTIVKPIKGMRKIIADNMYESLQSSAQLTLMRKADITKLLNLHKAVRADLENSGFKGKVTITAYLAKAVAAALQKHPEMNSAFVDNSIHLHEHVHLGIAVALQEGLMVPVIRHADKQTVGEIAGQIKSLSEKARNGSLSGDELTGSTFTITNLGASGIEYFTPVLNPPEAGILGIGSTQETAVFENGLWNARKMLPLSLTFDHRVLDGEPASQFLTTVVTYLQHPYRLFF
ncbi:2-oxo acid dehydrogenase subunit E2 [Bacillaceae bacterium Marseille-Q3522]|nr:2-oxo acid dehydrogenase subunit E2 [Bacillaceae bacterium Marseille-Q3522]